MHTVMATNNAYDSILLVDDAERVVSAWQADRETVEDFLTDTDASQWNAGEFASFANPADEDNEDELRTIAAYGEECGRDGIITSDERKQFWLRA